MAEDLDLRTNLAGCFTGAILYGMLTLLFFGALYVLFHKRRPAPRPNYVLVASAVIMFLLNTVFLAVSYLRVSEAFVQTSYEDGTLYLSEVSDWREVVAASVTLAVGLVGDATLIYRCWIVWDKRISVIVVPVVLLVVLLISSIFVSVSLTNVDNFPSYISEEWVPLGTHWIPIVYTIGVGQNSLVTSLIMYKIWKIDGQASQYRSGPGRSLRPVLAIVLESGLLFVTTTFLFLVLYCSGSDAAEVVVDALSPIIGITFYLLIVRVGLRRFDTQTTRALSTSSVGQGMDGTSGQSVRVVLERQGVDEESELELTVVGSEGQYEGKSSA